MTKIHDLESQIRDFVNAPRTQTRLLKNNATWGMLCSSLDAIGDTELAVKAYLIGEKQSQESEQDTETLRNTGNLYHSLYGILQVLFVQQDAVEHLAKALGIDYAHDPVLRDVRELRNDVIGHPTNRSGGKAFNSISRQSLSRSGCEFLTMFPDGTSTFKSIDVPDQIAAQRQAITTALTAILTKLKDDEMGHRRKFRGIKLADAFPQTLDHCHEKIGDSINERLPASFGGDMLKQIASYVAAFKQELSTRGSENAYDSLTCELDELDYPVAELLKYFSQPQDSKFNHKDAEICHFFIYKKLENIINIADEIDREYAEDI